MVQDASPFSNSRRRLFNGSVKYAFHFAEIITNAFCGGVAQWVARLTRDRLIPAGREFEPHQRPPLFP